MVLKGLLFAWHSCELSIISALLIALIKRTAGICFSVPSQRSWSYARSCAQQSLLVEHFRDLSFCAVQHRTCASERRKCLAAIDLSHRTLQLRPACALKPLYMEHESSPWLPIANTKVYREYPKTCCRPTCWRQSISSYAFALYHSRLTIDRAVDLFINLSRVFAVL